MIMVAHRNVAQWERIQDKEDTLAYGMTAQAGG
jgi:hypothetical protein